MEYVQDRFLMVNKRIQEYMFCLVIKERPDKHQAKTRYD
ncbi:hypothetical protein C2W64_04729 [Brevibacillus laterosporus]|nr:hypothetical protein C2W64_04729 [Brevibacillus laterosporus]